MNNDFIELKNKFENIKRMGLIKSKRKGTGGIGYTFETLLNKKEDQECKPDFKSVEIKCKLGYTKTPLTLFTCSPLRNGKYATRYIIEKYGYVYKTEPEEKFIFSRTLFAHYSRQVNGYEFKLKLDYYKTRLIMQSYYDGKFIEDVCYWEFEELEKKLFCKLANLAIIYGYPYTYNNILYYKYVKMEAYKLRGFFEFLQLISQDKIHILMYIKEGKSILGNPQMDTHGVAFKIKMCDIDQLFKKLKF